LSNLLTINPYWEFISGDDRFWADCCLTDLDQTP